jgi:hypothetical protein
MCSLCHMHEWTKPVVSSAHPWLRLRVQVMIFILNYRHIPLPLLLLIAYSHVQRYASSR